jgi:hypothetical protein
MPHTPPPYIIMSEIRTPLGDVQILIRVAGGQQTKVTVPAARATPEGLREAVDTAILLMPAPPGPDT